MHETLVSIARRQEAADTPDDGLDAARGIIRGAIWSLPVWLIGALLFAWLA